MNTSPIIQCERHNLVSTAHLDITVIRSNQNRRWGDTTENLHVAGLLATMKSD